MMVGPVPARDEETVGLTGARGDFVGSLGRRVEALRASLRAIEQNPRDIALRNGLLRRVHALSSASRVLGFASVSEALTEVERRLRMSEFGEVARSLDLLPSLVLGVPVSLRPPADTGPEREPATWPLSVLIFGAQGLAEAIQAIQGTHVECERTLDLEHAREQARLFGPDLAIIDADRTGARELVEAFAKDPLVEPVPLVVVGDFSSPEAASSFIALGAARVLAKPVSPDALRRTVVELRALAAEPRPARDLFGDLSVEALVDRISAEMRRGLLEAVEPNARELRVGFGDGADVMAAVWGAVARVRELVTLRSSGAVRFDSSGPEGAIPIAAWSNDERRAGDRELGSAAPRETDDVTLQGRRIVVADDDPAVVWFMSGLLKALGAEVLEAHDGARALALTYDNWPDLVVSDVLMPKLDGFSLCHEIKRDVAVRDVPVILLSWKEDLLQRVRELGASADGYLRKEAAAATVAERLREVLRPRARVERRIAAGGDVRGRLDGLTPRLILELASAGQRDVRVGIRDAVYLYEVQIRRGRLCSATRSAADGSFERGAFVLAALLGVSAGRFLIEPDASPCRAEFDGTAAEILKTPVERARTALNSISAGALVGVTRVHISAQIIEGYLTCTPEPARDLLRKVMSGASPRELITSGSVAPRLLEAVLSDVARRGGITDIERVGNEPSPLRGSLPPQPLPRTAVHALPLPVVPNAFAPSQIPLSRASAPPTAAPPLAAQAPASPPALNVEAGVSAETAGLFSLQVESDAPAPVVTKAAIGSARVDDSLAALPSGDDSKALPFSAEITPSVDRRWDTITEGVFTGSATLQGVGSHLPEVRASRAAEASPNTVPAHLPMEARREELDALASALTRDSPNPPAASPGAAVTELAAAPAAAGVVATDAPRGTGPANSSTAQPTDAAREPAPSPSLRASGARQEARSVAPAAQAAAVAPRPSTGSAAAWLVKALLAFAVSYAAVSYYKASVAQSPDHSPSPAPASPR
jgi:DNA-binding response OmpR family regulator